MTFDTFVFFTGLTDVHIDFINLFSTGYEHYVKKNHDVLVCWYICSTYTAQTGTQQMLNEYMER